MAGYAEGERGTGETEVQRQVDGLPINRRHLLVFGLCGAGLFFESLNLQIMSFVAPLLAREWGLGPKALGLAISAAIMGMLVGTYAFGAIADRFGRRAAFQATVGLFSLMTALSGLATGLGQLVAARFVAGIGIGGSIPVETAVLAEFTPGRVRGRAMALWAAALPLGGMAAPLIVAAMPEHWGWRALLFLGGVPAILVLFVRRAIPETPQYLAAKGRRADARRSIEWIAGHEMPELGGPTETSGDCVPPPAPRVAPERQLFAGQYRRATFVAWALNFGTFFAYYGFVLWLPALLGTVHGFARADVLSFMFLLALSGLIGRFGLLTLADRFRRETLILTYTVAAAGALAVFAVQTDYAPMVMAACIAAFLLEGVFSAVIPFVAEIYPAAIRATGVGWAGGMGRVATAIAPLMIGYLVSINHQAAVIALSLGSLVAAVAILIWRRGSTNG